MLSLRGLVFVHEVPFSAMIPPHPLLEVFIYKYIDPSSLSRQTQSIHSHYGQMINIAFFCSEETRNMERILSLRYDVSLWKRGERRSVNGGKRQRVALAHDGSEQPDAPAFRNSLSHRLGSEWAIEPTNERGGACEQSEQCGASKWAIGRASGFVFTPGFLVVLDHSVRQKAARRWMDRAHDALPMRDQRGKEWNNGKRKLWWKKERGKRQKERKDQQRYEWLWWKIAKFCFQCDISM